MSYLIRPKCYRPLLDKYATEQGIKMIKDFFQQNLATGLRLHRVTGPLFVLRGLGINDDLSGTERPVTFPIKDLGDAQAEVVHSLAKWKRLTLAEHGIEPGYGIYTDMNAIRADEELGNLHSLYVDQWDWERVIVAEERTLDFLRATVERIYAALQRTEFLVCERFPQIKPCLPESVHFIHAEELRRRYPDLTPKEREDRIVREYGERPESPEQRLRDKDKRRAAYHRFFTDMKWGYAKNYRISLDSGALGIAQCVAVLKILY